MSIKRVFLAAVAATALTIGFAPIAQASQVGSGVCIEHHDHGPGPEGRLRDLVKAPKVDRLQRWIEANPELAERAEARAASGGAAVEISTWIHVIRKDDTVAGGNVPAQWIQDQMKVLNDSFLGRTGGADTGFKFVLEGVTRTTNKGWFNLTGYGQDEAMKEALKVGGPETLNIYTAKLGAQLLGYAYLAQDAEAVGALDGVVVHYQSLPGGNFEIYSEGDTATHEVGHWLDLFHTFEGGCEGEGDHVADTAPEASPAFRCPEGRDTCVGGGLDPITNFMDYSQDSCMFEFTEGQTVRMQQAWLAFRAP
jgi:Pregnancy-associated plasma protein-A